LLVLAGSPQLTRAADGHAATPRIVAYVISALKMGDLANARALVNQYRKLNGDTPEALEAFSWLARGEVAAGNSDAAQADATEIEQLAKTALSTRPLDAEPHLPLALGAAYEVQADLLKKQNQRTEALQLLRAAIVTWRGTSLVDRLQKNINLLTLQGKPMPLLQQADWIGAKPAAAHPERGKPTLLFFWAHWCPDCKAEAPIMRALAEEFGPRGLVILAPTRYYGYTAQEENATPAVEKSFMEKVFERYYSQIPGILVPVDSGNFTRFGVSTTPTIVLADRRGTVRLYHPGAMDQESLAKAIEQVLAPAGAAPKSAGAGR